MGNIGDIGSTERYGEYGETRRALGDMEVLGNMGSTGKEMWGVQGDMESTGGCGEYWEM